MSDHLPVEAVDHISWTVPDIEAALAFYTDVIGGTLLFRLGPFDAADMPRGEDGRDWMESHLGIPGARVSLAMLQLTPNMKFQLIQYDKPADRRQEQPRNCDRGGHHLGLRVLDVNAACRYLAAHGCKVLKTIEVPEGPLAGKKNVYVQDPFGNQLEIVD